MKKIVRLMTALCILSALLLTNQPVRADMAPPPAPQLSGMQPFQYQNTNVQMAYERVEMELMDVPPDSPSYKAQQEVTVNAWFVMHNTGSADEKMQVIFPGESMQSCLSYEGDSAPPSYIHYQFVPDSFASVIDGKQAEISTVVTDHPYKGHGSCDTMNWFAFNAVFPAGKDVLVRISYRLSNTRQEFIQNIEYTLETGAGWKGPIQNAYIIFRSPYLLTSENILKDTTSGYQVLENEIFWNYKNLEPTHKDNILVSVLDQSTWKNILSYRDRLNKQPEDVEAWVGLAESYQLIAFWHGDMVRNDYFYQKAKDTYQSMLSTNLRSADLYASYARWVQLEKCTPSEMIKCEQDYLPYVEQALAIDPSNDTANELFGEILEFDPGINYRPPPTLTPTDGPSPTPSPITGLPQIEEPTSNLPPTYTHQPTQTLNPSDTPTPTKLPSDTPTETPKPASRSTLTPAFPGPASANPVAIFGFAAVLLIAVVIFLGRKKR